MVGETGPRAGDALRGRRDEIAEAWHATVARIGFGTLGPTRTRDRLARLAERAISLLLADPWERAEARAVGAELVRLGYGQPEALGATHALLAERLTRGLRAEELPSVRARLGELLAEISVGFLAQARDTILAEQERIRLALLAERDRAEGALRRSEAGLAEAQRVAHLGSWEVDLRTGEVRLSDEVYRIFGEAPGGFAPTNKDFLARVHPEDRGLVERSMRGAAAGGGPYDIEHRVVRSGGEVRWVHARGEAVRDAGGAPARLVGTTLDVTERARAQEALRRSEASLAEAQRVAHVGHWDWDIASDELRWSEEIHRIFGVDRGDFGGTLEAFRELVHPGDRDGVEESARRALAGGGPCSVDHRVVRPDGEVRWVHQRYEVERDASGRPARMVGTVHDVTDRKCLEERLEHLAYHDPLTGLPNRAALFDRLRAALAGPGMGREAVAVLFLDVDGLKRANDSWGHEAGDELLAAIAGRLRGCVRPGDTAARLAGDEFVLLLPRVEGVGEAAGVAGRALGRLSAPFHVRGHEVRIAASIGIALGSRGEADPDGLLREADAAMYRAKARGGSGYEVARPPAG